MSISASDKYGTLKAADAVLELPVGGYGTVGIQLSGTWVGTVTFEGTVDHGTWQTLSVTLTNSTTRVTTATTNGVWVGGVAGLRTVRVRMSAYTSGTASAQLLAAGTGGGGSGGGGGAGSDVNLIEVGGSSIALGQAAMAASLPVVIASNQTAIPITGSITASNPSVGPTGDPVPAEATLMGVEDPAGELASLAIEKFDYDTDGGGSQAQSAIGLVIPAAGGPVPVGAANPLPVSGTVTTGGLTDAQLRATPVPVSGTVTANIGTVGTLATAAKQDTGNTSLASIDGKITAVNTGAVVIASGTVTAVTAITNALPAGNNNIGDVDVVTVNAQSADDDAVAGTPVRVSGLAKSPDGTDPGAVAEGDTANLTTDLNRRLFVNTHHPQSVPVHLNGSSAYTDQAFFPDPGDGFEIVMTSFQCSSGAATAINFFLEEGSTIVYGPIYLEAVAGRGFVSGPINRRFTASTAVTLTSSAAIAQSIDAEYYIQKV